MRAQFWCGFLLCLAAVVGRGFSPTNGAEPSGQGKIEFVNRDHGGRVTVVAKDSITIETPEYTHRTQELGPDRVPRWVTKIIPAQPPTRFAVSEVLAAGQVPRLPRDTGRPGHTYRVFEESMYRLSDVKVGDWVQIIYARVNGVDICDHIQIVKRPGGRVPPLPDGVEKRLQWFARWPEEEGVPRPELIPYHERKNAYWDLKDKGIPYPEKFGHMRRFPIAPAPRLAAVREVSPPPRLATVPSIPPAAP